MFLGQFGDGLPEKVSLNLEEAYNLGTTITRRDDAPDEPRQHQSTLTTRSQLSLSSVASRRQTYGHTKKPPSLVLPEDNLEFMQYLEEVVQGIKSLKDWEKVAEHKVELALETLSHGQQSVVIALQQRYMEDQQSSKPFNNQAAQYWNDLEKLQTRLKNTRGCRKKG
jgi:hypothetical protein